MSDEFTPGKYKTPGTPVPKPEGFHRARAHEVTKPVLAFANEVLKVANPEKLPQAQVIGKRLPGIVDGTPVLGQIEWHFDNHPARPSLGLGPMEGEPFYHMGVTLYLPDEDIAAGEERIPMSKFDYLRAYFGASAPAAPSGRTTSSSKSRTISAPTSRTTSTSKSRTIAAPTSRTTSTTSRYISPPTGRTTSSTSSGQYIAPPTGRTSSYIAPPTGRTSSYIAPPTGRYQTLSLGPDRRSAFDSPMHHHFGHPNDWRTQQGGNQDQSYRQMQQQAQQRATMDSLTPEDSYAPSYESSMAPRQQPRSPSMRDDVNETMPDNTPMSLFLPPQDDDQTDLSVDSEINDEDLSNPADSEDDVQIAADFGAGKRRSGKRKTSSSSRTSSSSSSSQGRHHHHHHKKNQDQQQQQSQAQDPGGGGSSGGGSSGSSGSNGGGQQDDDDDYDDSGDSFEGSTLPGSFGFDGFGYQAGSASRKFG